MKPSRISLISSVIVLGCGSFGGYGSPPGSPPDKLAVAVFSSDATPPVGHPLFSSDPVQVVDEPLWLKGIVLEDGKSRYVVCALDWHSLQGRGYDLFREKLAAAAEIPVSHVAIQSIHQHSAPWANVSAQQLLKGQPSAPLHVDLRFMEEVTDRAAAAVRRALGEMRPFTHVGSGKAKVERFASNRRVVGSDGRIHTRWSTTKDVALREAPEGRIDPWLRTVTLYGGEVPLVRLHYYATHPMTHYGDGHVHPDVPGLVRRQLESEEGVPQIYFTGCGGDITPGKYNDGTLEARVQLKERLAAAMKQSIADTRRTPVSKITWTTVDVRFPLSVSDGGDPSDGSVSCEAGKMSDCRQLSEATLRKQMSDGAADPGGRIVAALFVAWIERSKADSAVQLSRLELGPVDILHLPGESFLEYQLYAQILHPDRFVAVAAYGEGGPWYICTDRALREGGYEPAASMAGPSSESAYKAAIAALWR